jgi:tetratricopeptide (TPR) repeat protein
MSLGLVVCFELAIKNPIHHSLFIIHHLSFTIQIKQKMEPVKSERQIQLESFLKEEPDDPFTNYALALEYSKSGNKSAALEKMEWLLLHHPSYLATYFQLGLLYEESGRKDQAIAIYEKGMLVAEAQKNRNTFNELRSAKEALEEDQ